MPISHRMASHREAWSFTAEPQADDGFLSSASPQDDERGWLVGAGPPASENSGSAPQFGLGSCTLRQKISSVLTEVCLLDLTFAAKLKMLQIVIKFASHNSPIYSAGMGVAEAVT